MFVASDGDLMRVWPLLVWQLDANAVVIADLVDGGSLPTDDVGMVLGLNCQRYGETTQLLYIYVLCVCVCEYVSMQV